MSTEMEVESKTVSFGFSKTVANKKIEKSSVAEDVNSESFATDFVFSLEGKEVHSSLPSDEKQEYIIPLKKTKREGREWINKVKFDPEGVSGNYQDSEAIKEIIADSSRQNKEWNDGDDSEYKNMAIPLLMQRKLENDVDGPSEEPQEADYDEIPLQHFGLAMMRGMGWKDGDGIGKSNKSIAPVEAVLRPKGLGLGADRSEAATLNKTKNVEDSKNEDKLVLKKGTSCVVQKGRHVDLYGIIEGIDEDNARVIVKLALNAEIVTLSQYGIKLVSQKEYEKYSKYLNKGKVDKYKKDKSSRESEYKGDRDDRYKSDKSTSHRHKHKKPDRHDERDRSDKKRKTDRDEKYFSSSNGTHSEGVLWIRTDIRVRFIDKHYKKGKYYKSKVTTVDVFDKDNCLCKTDDGRILENVSQSMLETLIPKTEPGYVVIVSGKYKNQIAQILKKDKKNCIATLQLLQDRDIVLTLSYDSICEYCGDIESEFYY